MKAAKMGRNLFLIGASNTLQEGEGYELNLEAFRSVNSLRSNLHGLRTMAQVPKGMRIKNIDRKTGFLLRLPVKKDPDFWRKRIVRHLDAKQCLLILQNRASGWQKQFLISAARKLRRGEAYELNVVGCINEKSFCTHINSLKRTGQVSNSIYIIYRTQPGRKTRFWMVNFTQRYERMMAETHFKQWNSISQLVLKKILWANDVWEDGYRLAPPEKKEA